jgi:putative ABC transport system ATP-binding protein
MDAIRIDDLCFSWSGETRPLLVIPRFEVHKNEKLLIKGPSGSGKSTLLNLIAGLLEPQEGEICVLQTNLTDLNLSQRDQFRVDHMGFLFQTFNLIPYLSVLENVLLPCLFSKLRKQRSTKMCSMQESAKKLLNQLDLDLPEIARKPVLQLSVGQQQRVAAARALIGYPDIVIADEPTSALDPDHREAFLNGLFEQCEASSTTLLYVSHDPSIANHFDRVLDIREINRAEFEEGKHVAHSIGR